GDWRAHGARRARTSGVVAGGAAIVRAAGDRAAARHGRRGRGRAAAPLAAGADQPERSGDARFDRAAVRLRLAGRVLLAGAARHPPRSRPRAEIRIAGPPAPAVVLPRASMMLARGRMRGMAFEVSNGMTAADPRVRYVLALMERHCAQPLSVAALARAVNLSPAHLRRMFQHELGKSPSRVWRELRLDRARHPPHTPLSPGQ